MVRFNSKGKGSSYERSICRLLSRWITNGEKDDCFWRSSLSGGRATVAHRKGQSVRQAGDITAVAPEGHILTDFAYLELKHYRNLDIESFFLTGKGALAGFWEKTIQEGRKHQREPVLIAKQNHTPDLIITRPPALKRLTGKTPTGRVIRIKHAARVCEVRLLEDVLACPFKVT